MFEDFVYLILTNLEANLVEKFLADFKVVPSMQMCWGISNRVEKSWEKNENVAHQNVFQMTTMPPCKNVSTSSKTQFCSNRGKKQHFLVENTFFCWKTEETLKIKQLCWMINLVMLDILQAFFIQKLLFPWNYSVLKSADQFEEILNYFKKLIKAFVGALIITNNRKTFKKLLCHHLTFRLRCIKYFSQQKFVAKSIL